MNNIDKIREWVEENTRTLGQFVPELNYVKRDDLLALLDGLGDETSQVVMPEEMPDRVKNRIVEAMWRFKNNEMSSEISGIDKNKDWPDDFYQAIRQQIRN